MQQRAFFFFRQTMNGDLRPGLHHIGNIFTRKRDVFAEDLGFFDLILQTKLLGAAFGGLLEIILFGGFVFLQLYGGKLPLQLVELQQAFVVKVDLSGGLVDQVDGFVGQEALMDIPGGKVYGVFDHRVGNDDVMEGLVVRPDAFQDLDGIFGRGLVDHHGLETAFQSGILFDILAVLVESRGADDLDLALGERGLQDVGRVHRVLGIAGADQVVDFVDHKDDVSCLHHFVDQAFHTAFELTAELRARNDAGHIQQTDLFVQQFYRNLAACDAQGKPLRDRGFADAGLAEEHRIVFGTAVQDLHDALDFGVAADDVVDLTMAGGTGQACAEAGQVRILLFAALFGLRIVLVEPDGLLCLFALEFAGHVAVFVLSALRGGAGEHLHQPGRQHGRQFVHTFAELFHIDALHHLVQVILHGFGLFLGHSGLGEQLL